MKRRLVLILSVGITLFTRYSMRNHVIPGVETEKTEISVDTGEIDVAENTEIPIADQAENEETKKEQNEVEMPVETESEKETVSEASAEAGLEEKAVSEAPALRSVSQSEQKTEAEPVQERADVPEQEETIPEEEKPEETKPEEAEQQEQAVAAVSYNPLSVCSQAIVRCQAGGMITTTDNLANLLAEGRITQEEYDSCYPYDGLGYYSVFVETDLNQASTTSGRKLGSEEGIAEYIADMMLLETEPVFHIEYAGVYNLNGMDFYEFRCYR